MVLDRPAPVRAADDADQVQVAQSAHVMARHAERDLQRRREAARGAWLVLQQRPQDLDAHRVRERARPGEVDARATAGTDPRPGVSLPLRHGAGCPLA